jgi:hypothetical protein
MREKGEEGSRVRGPHGLRTDFIWIHLFKGKSYDGRMFFGIPKGESRKYAGLQESHSHFPSINLNSQCGSWMTHLMTQFPELLSEPHPEHVPAVVTMIYISKIVLLPLSWATSELYSLLTWCPPYPSGENNRHGETLTIKNHSVQVDQDAQQPRESSHLRGRSL